MLRKTYQSLVTPEARYRLYRMRNPVAFRRLRQEANIHEKGVFSLRQYDARQAIFVHITKTAGTSVAKSLFGELPYHYTAWEYRVIFGRRDFGRYFKFAFARNPWDRLYSAFSYLKGGGWDDADAAWSSRHLGGIEDFNQFVLDWLSPDRITAHIHFRPQSWFLCDHEGRILVDYLGRYERLSQDFSHIAERVNPQAALINVNKSRRSDYRNAYSAAAIEKVGDLYRADIELLGYTFDGRLY